MCQEPRQKDRLISAIAGFRAAPAGEDAASDALALPRSKAYRRQTLYRYGWRGEAPGGMLDWLDSLALGRFRW